MRRAWLLASLFVFTYSSFAQPQQFITTASGVRARAAASTNSDEVTRLPIGSLVKQVDMELRAGQVGDKNDYWYHVALPNGKEGWVFGSFITRFVEKQRGEIYLQIARTKAKTEKASFAELADLSRFLSTAITEITERTSLAELELWRWIALQQAFNNIESDKIQQPEYQRFIKANQSNAIYSEPGGVWLVKADLLWNLQKKYADLPVAEMIAWEAASQSLPGECEGDDTCATMYLNQTKGRYLQLYPTGKHAGDALDEFVQMLQGINEQMKQVATPKGNSKEDRQIRQSALAAIAQVRLNVAKVTHPKKTTLLQLLAQYEKYYRPAQK